MKRIYFISLVAVTMILLGADMKSSARINDNSGRNSLAFITYQVNITPDHNLLANSCSSQVEIINSAGVAIGQSQIYYPGMNTYYFYELGPVHEIRKAIITNQSTNGTDHSIPCFLISWVQTRTPGFLNAQTYTFFLSAPGSIQQNNMVNDE
jgi:hypothetical protein